MVKNNLNKILFIPSYDYLSNSIFMQLLPKFSNFNNFLLLTDELISNPQDSELLKVFEKSYIVRSNIGLKKNQYFLKIKNKLRFINELKKIFLAINPSFVITTSDALFSIRLLKFLFPEIKIFIIQPSFFDININEISYITKVKNNLINFMFNLPIYPRQYSWGCEYEDNNIFVWGQYFKNMLTKEINEKNIHIAGYTDLISCSDEEVDELISKYSLPKNKKIVSIFTDALLGLYTKDEIIEIAKTYNTLIKSRKDLFFIIKPHPRENSEFMEYLLKNIDLTHCKVIENEEITKILKASNIQISCGSVTSFKALVIDIDVVIFLPFKDKAENLKTFDDAVLYAKNITDINDCINVYTNGKLHKNYKYLENMISNKKNTYENIFNIINEEKVK